MQRFIIFLVGILVGVGSVFYLNREYPGETEVLVAPPLTPVVPSPASTPIPPIGSAPAVMPPGDETNPNFPVTPPSAPAEPVATSPTPAVAPSVLLRDGKLLLPVEGIRSNQLTDTYTQSRGTDRVHEAIDIMAPKGTHVLAAADGKVVKLFNSKAGGLTVYQFDTGEKLAYYYAHLDSYAPGVVEGKQLKRGDLVGFVGSTGNASPAAPHLHFAIFELGPEKQWWKGTAINPYPLLVN